MSTRLPGRPQEQDFGSPPVRQHQPGSLSLGADRAHKPLDASLGHTVVQGSVVLRRNDPDGGGWEIIPTYGSQHQTRVPERPISILKQERIDPNAHWSRSHSLWGLRRASGLSSQPNPWWLEGFDKPKGEGWGGADWWRSLLDLLRPNGLARARSKPLKASGSCCGSTQTQGLAGGKERWLCRDQAGWLHRWLLFGLPHLKPCL